MRGQAWSLALLVLPATMWSQAQPKRLAAVDNLKSPEALSYAATVDAYFVSNMAGRDGHGFVTRIRGKDGVVDSLHFITGLTAPMGSRVKGDTLWLVDLTALKGFDVRSGALVATIDLSSVHPLFLNDMAIGPDGDFYVTDTGVSNDKHTGPDRIYHVARNRQVHIVLESPALDRPDGIDWDPQLKRLVLAPIGGDSVQELAPGAKAPTDIAPGAGRYDGIEIEKDGAILITSWNDSSVLSLRGHALVRRQHFSPGQRYATGIRNAVGLALDPSGSVWSTQHGRDQLGENFPKLYTLAQSSDLPAEELMHLASNADFGWPECYYDQNQKKLVLAPEYGGDGGKAVGVCDKKQAPAVAFPGHWAPDGLVFYTGSMFPSRYQSGAFIAFHGSWDRPVGSQEGYKVVFQPFANGSASGPYETFADGFAGAIVQPDKALHRPTGLAVAPDGALFITDDKGGRVWRVTHLGAP